MRRNRFEDNIILEYSLVSVVTTLLITTIMILIIGQLIQPQQILAYGSFYKEFISTFPINYKKTLTSNDIYPHEGCLDLNASYNWEHLKTNLTKLPFIQSIKLMTPQNEVLWIYLDNNYEGNFTTFLKHEIENEDISFRINSNEPDLIITYTIPIKFENKNIAIFEILIKNNNLKKNIKDSKRHFSIFVVLSGVLQNSHTKT